MNKQKRIQQVFDASQHLIDNSLVTFKNIFSYITSFGPENIAMVHHSKEDQNVREYSYAQLSRFTKSFANKLFVLLKENAKNSIVGLKLRNTPAWCFIFWGLLMAGYRPLLIDNKLAKENTETLLKNSNAVAIITDDKQEYSVKTLTKDNINDISEDLHFNERWVDEVVFCSSGTTGDIKMVVFNGLNMLHQINCARNIPHENLDICYPPDIGPCRVIALLPLHHIFAFAVIFLWFSFYNATIVFTDFIDPMGIANEIRSLHVTHVFHVPLFYEVIAKNFMNSVEEKDKAKVLKLIDYNNQKITRKDAGLFIRLVEHKVKDKLFGNQIKFMICGGGFISESVSEIMNGLYFPLYNGYGMTEVGVTSVELSTNPRDRIKRSIGHPFFGVSYKIGNKNELFVKSNITHIKEIVNGVEKLTKFDKEGYFATGDIVDVDKDNRYYLKGRLKDVIILSNGENVYPDEIESYFKKVKGVHNVAAFGSKNKIVLVVETRINQDTIHSEIDTINKTLPIHKQVNDIVYTSYPLPLSSSMKVKRFVVQEMYENGEYNRKKKKKVNILKGYDKHQVEETTKKLQKVYKKVLFLNENVDPDGHWINDLHSDSLTYITLVSEIEKEFNTKFPVEKYGQLTTLNEFAKDLIDNQAN